MCSEVAAGILNSVLILSDIFFVVSDPICSVGNGIYVSLLSCNPCGAKHPTLFRVVESVACHSIVYIFDVNKFLSD